MNLKTYCEEYNITRIRMCNKKGKPYTVFKRVEDFNPLFQHLNIEDYYVRRAGIYCEIWERE